MDQSLVYLPGQAPPGRTPLDRYLPRLPRGAVAAWLKENVKPGDWVLEPFGASPHLAVEAAQAGYRVLAAVNNPIARFLIEMAAAPPSRDDLLAALADLGTERRGDERLEPHIQDLYATFCDECRQAIVAEAFLWEREAAGPYARIYTCPHCGHSGEYPALPSDIEKAEALARPGPYRARAMERVAKADDPEREYVEEALSVYLPRAVYAVFTVINRLVGAGYSEEQYRLLAALALSACDRANTLWDEAKRRTRPKQLNSPPKFYEYNVWRAFEAAVDEWAVDAPQTPLTYWPEEPPESGGICIYDGRSKDLALELDQVTIAAVVGALPRPNQAFWTLSALWAGWLWGREALGPFSSVLSRRRYDWAWHTRALRSSLARMGEKLAEETPFYGLVTESETGFDLAVLVAAHLSGFRLEGMALRVDEGQTQLVWRRGALPTKTKFTAASIQSAARQVLGWVGEPLDYLVLQNAILFDILKDYSLTSEDESPADIFNRQRDVVEEAIGSASGLQRFEGSEKSLEVGKWWLYDQDAEIIPLSDKVERQVVGYLLNHPGAALAEFEADACRAFPGVLTPSRELIWAILQSYGEEQDGVWQIRENDRPKARRGDLDEMKGLLQTLGERFGFKVAADETVMWQKDDDPVVEFHLMASALLGEEVYGVAPGDHGHMIVMPGGRAGLALFKQKDNPYLQYQLSRGWTFLKFRWLRRLSADANLTWDTWQTQVGLDPLSEDEAQLPLL